MSDSRKQLPSRKPKPIIALKLEVQTAKPSYSTPWVKNLPVSNAGTLTPLEFEGKFFYITNAHVVTNAIFIRATTEKFSTSLTMEVSWSDPVLDIAILAFKNPMDAVKIKNTVQHLKLITNLLPAGTEVTATGYSGGSSITETHGIISKTDMMRTTGSSVLTVQTTAAFNPGNSGGPMIIFEEDANQIACVGIASAYMSNQNSVGYYIPAISVQHVIHNYLKYYRFKKLKFIDYITIPDMRFDYQNTKNPSLRSYLGLSDQEDIGVRITFIPKRSSLNEVLKVGDIVVEIDNHTIRADGKINVPELASPVTFDYLIQSKYLYDKVNVKVLRKGEDGILKSENLDIRLSECLGKGPLFGIADGLACNYYIQPSGEEGGFVFVALDVNYINSYINIIKGPSGIVQDSTSMPPMVKKALYGQNEIDDDVHEVIILHSVFESHQTADLRQFSALMRHDCEGDRIKLVNNKRITNMHDLISAFENNDDITITFIDGINLNVKPKPIKKENAITNVDELSNIETELPKGDNKKPSMVELADGTVFCVPHTPNKTNTEAILKQRYNISFFSSPCYPSGVKLQENKNSVLTQIKELDFKDGEAKVSTVLKRM